MIDSLTVSILLFVALAIGAVVAWDAWRAWRLRRLAVRNNPPPARATPEPPAEAPPDLPESRRAPVTARSEPSLGVAPVVRDDVARAEPQLGSIATPLSVAAVDAGAGHLGDPSRAPAAPWAGAVSVTSSPAVHSVNEPTSTPSRLSELPPRKAEPPQAADELEAAPFHYLDSRPVAGAAKAVSAARPDLPVEDPRPVQAVIEPPPASVGAGLGVAGAASVLSERTDCIAMLRFLQPIQAERLVSLGQSLRRSGSKPVMLEVLGEPAVIEGWHSPRAGESCGAARFGLLLANRAGPVNALEYTDFAQRVREVAATLGVGVELADMTSTLARARQLDSDSARLDAQVCIHVDAAEVLGPAQLAGLSGPLAVVERGNNRYARLGPRGETLFSVALGEQSNRLSFLLDVPRVDPSCKPFEAMVECVRIGARRLPGRIMDDGGKPLSDRGIEAITRELDQRCAALAAAGLPAGSVAALRVFN